MAVKLTGPRIAPKSGVIRRLVVLVHGYGASGQDLIELGASMRDALPDTAFVAPTAPEFCAQAPPGGRQWFTLTSRSAEERWRGAVSARAALDGFLNDELAAAHLDDSHLALVGFSQGAMMVLHVGLRRARAPAAIVAYSGVLIGLDHADELTARDGAGRPPPVLMLHGDRDEVVPIEGMFASVEALAKVGIPAQWRLEHGVGHAIDSGGVQQGALFLAQAFGLPPRDAVVARVR